MGLWDQSVSFFPFNLMSKGIFDADAFILNQRGWISHKLFFFTFSFVNKSTVSVFEMGPLFYWLHGMLRCARLYESDVKEFAAPSSAKVSYHWSRICRLVGFAARIGGFVTKIWARSILVGSVSV